MLFPILPFCHRAGFAIECGTGSTFLHLGMARTRMKERFDMAGHIYILLTLLFTVYGQLVLKWQMGQAPAMPDRGLDKLLFLLQQFFNPWIMSGFFSAFLASLAWMAAMTRFE